MSESESIPGKGGRPRGWSPALRAILRQPNLGLWLRNVELDLLIAWCWRVKRGAPAATFREWEMMGELNNWTVSDFALADAKVEELCNRDIWQCFPGGVQAGGGFHTKHKKLTMEEVSLKWKSCIRAGRHDAIIALIMALASNLQAVTLYNFDGDQDYYVGLIPSKARWVSFQFSDDADFLQLFFRGAANSQLAALETSNGGSTDMKKESGGLLPCLKSIKIRTQEEAHDMEMRRTLSYLALPSLEYASLKDLDDDRDINKDIVGVNLSLKSLELRYQSHGVYSAGRLLACCPNLSHLSYSTTVRGNASSSWENAPAVVPHLAKIAPQLKSFTLGNNDFVSFHYGKADPAVEKIAAFEQLKELDTHWEHLHKTVVKAPGALWHVLPMRLEKLTLRNVTAESFVDVLKEIKGLAKAREALLVPNLKGVVIIHERTIERLKRAEDKLVFDAMEEVCRNAPISVTQRYREPEVTVPATYVEEGIVKQWITVEFVNGLDPSVDL